MSTTAVTGVLDRTMRDEAFLDSVLADPDGTLDDCDLTDAERDALVSGSDRRVHEVLGEAKLGWDVSVVVIVIP